MAKPELSDPISLRLPVDVLAGMERVADASERTRSWVMVRAMRLYLASEGEEILRLAKGRRQARNGEVEDMDDVIADIEKIVHGAAA